MVPAPEKCVVPVKLGNRSYKIVVQNHLLDSIPEGIAQLPELSTTRHYVVVSDRTVHGHYGKKLDSLMTDSVKVDHLIVDDGEVSKSISMLDSLLQQMVELGSDRSTVVIALGGGVVGDLAGFLAATYMRGVKLIQIPTSLLAQVDSSVGGKVGVNLPQGKNLVGAFLQPNAVFIDPQVLSTLDARNFSAGMAEVIKYGVILDLNFFEWLETNRAAIRERQDAVLVELIAACCRFKAEVVRQDEFESTGVRAILNYGHTLGHAIESTAGYGAYLHGEAISIGMHFAATLSVKMERLDANMIERQKRLLESFDLPTKLTEFDAEQLIGAMYQDKKSSHQQLNFVLPERIGHVSLVPNVSEEQIRSAMEVAFK